ncbi:MAG: response regulator transcription factor [Elusimicrobia bacterium]|nr:response regulator transcription factor [Elusimicrobiota bacterium]
MARPDPKKILIVEDDVDLRAMLMTVLDDRYAMVMLDMRLPGMHGLDVIRVLRGNPETRDMLVFAVSGGEDADAALGAGADDYLAKPADAEVLAARIAALLRRSDDGAARQPERFRVGPLLVVPDQREATLGGKGVDLTALEFRLLVYFLRNANRVLTRQIVLEQAWGAQAPMDGRAVDEHVESLRRKLGDFGGRFETVIQTGYTLNLAGS